MHDYACQRYVLVFDPVCAFIVSEQCYLLNMYSYTDYTDSETFPSKLVS